MNRPKLNKNIFAKDFADYYWLKEELILFCRKIDISNRIARYLAGGTIDIEVPVKKISTTSTFDWNNEVLNTNTIITDNYKNTENVRNFFRRIIGVQFKFNVVFMDWMKANTGKTLEDAMVTWRKIAELKKDKTLKPEIAPQFEYNTYIRDFLNDNPQLSLKDAIRHWKFKREKPGVKKYERADLKHEGHFNS